VSAPPGPRLLPLGGGTAFAAGAARLGDQEMPNAAARPGPATRLDPDARLNDPGRPGPATRLDPDARLDLEPRLAGDKAARLARAAAAGLAVLPGWVVPVAEGRPALSAGAAAVRAGRPASARRAVLGRRLDDDLAAELREAVTRLGGRVIVRSSSPLEGDPRWSGAFSSVAEVGADDVVAAVRSCWASAFAVDPLGRLAACGLPPEALELGVLLQPEIRPAAGGVARVTQAAGGAAAEVTVEGVLGHPGALLSGWAEGASAHVRSPGGEHEAGRLPAASPGPGPVPSDSGPPGQGGLAELVGPATVAAVADLAGRAWRLLGDDAIEWAAAGGRVWLLQSRRSTATIGGDRTAQATAGRAGSGQADAGLADAGLDTVGRAAAEELAGETDGLPMARARMPLLVATVLRRGEHVPGRPGAPGTAAGRLLPCRPHERPAGDWGDAILLIDRPLPALAPLLFAARGVIARAGAPGSHLAEVARSLGVPMVLGCHPERAAGAPAIPDGAFLAAIDGSTGDVALLPAAGDWPAGRVGSDGSALSDLLHPASVLPAPGLSGQRM
jgi:phosphohistidine swiveling domain-containing protein